MRIVPAGVEFLHEINRLRNTIGWCPWSASEKAIIAAYETALGAFEGEQMVGWCGSLRVTGVDAVIVDLMVDEAHRSKGLGSLLVRGTLQLLRQRQIRCVRLSTSLDLAAWFERLGFRRGAVGEDANHITLLITTGRIRNGG